MDRNNIQPNWENCTIVIPTADKCEQIGLTLCVITLALNISILVMAALMNIVISQRLRKITRLLIEFDETSSYSISTQTPNKGILKYGNNKNPGVTFQIGSTNEEEIMTNSDREEEMGLFDNIQQQTNQEVTM